ncbi:CPBP family intramembrane metalloprotease [Xanthomonas sp. Kuri4-1]
MTAPPSPSSPPPYTPLPPAPAGPPPATAPVLGFFLDLLIGVLVLLVLSVAAGLVWGLYRGFVLAQQAHRQGMRPDPHLITAALGQPGAMAQMLMALVSTGGAALVLYLWRRRAGPVERRQSYAAVRHARTWGWTAAVAVAVFLFSNLTSAFAQALGIQPAPTNLPLMEQALAQWPLFLVVFAVVLAPAYEELLFRRVLFGRLLAAGRPWLGIVLSSAAFALMHEVPGISGNGPLAIAQLWLVYGAMGAAFAWLYWRTGTLWASIAAHALNNAIALAALYFFGIQ